MKPGDMPCSGTYLVFLQLGRDSGAGEDELAKLIMFYSSIFSVCIYLSLEVFEVV